MARAMETEAPEKAFEIHSVRPYLHTEASVPLRGA